MSHQILPVTFLNGEGQRLFGMLHQPDVPRQPDVAILLLSPGVKARVAPHRLYNKMAARFVALGYPVLRFDFHGLGDSEGESSEALLADLYGAIQVGRYVGDTVAAMNWLQDTYGYSSFIASGLCGGALTGLLAAQRDSRIICLIGLAIPVILDGSHLDFTKYMTDAQLKGTRTGYMRKFKVWDPHVWRSWMRFLTFRSHYSLIARSVVKPFLNTWRRPEASASLSVANELKDNTNPYFAPAFECMVSTARRVLLVFAESDRLLWEYDVKFVQRHRASLDAYAGWYEMHVTSQANHIFSFTEWQQDMMDQCCRWLERGVGAPPAGVADGSRRAP